MKRKGVLLVDDEALTLKYFSKSFGSRFTVFSATSPREALKILEDHGHEIGVIVTDQRMPETSGVELLKVVRDLYPETTRVLTTAYSEVDVLVRAINVGAVHFFVAKPWSLDELEQTLAGALDEQARRTANPAQVEDRINEFRAKIIEDRAYDVGLIAAKVGHYVHNALCPVTFLLDHLLEHRHDPSSYPVEFLQNVRVHINDVARTLKDLEDVSVPAAPGEFDLVDLEDVYLRALAATEVIRKQKPLILERSGTVPMPQVYGVPAQLEKLFRFMIAEEIVSLPAGSVVRLEVTPHQVDGETLGVKVDFEDFVPVSPCVDPDSLLHPFNLRGSNPREFGIFLVSCYFIARHHGGAMTARAKDEGGIIFSFFLPSDPREALTGSAVTVTEAPP